MDDEDPRIDELERENARLRARAAELEDEVDLLHKGHREGVKALADEIVRLDLRVAELETRIDEAVCDGEITQETANGLLGGEA